MQLNAWSCNLTTASRTSMGSLWMQYSGAISHWESWQLRESKQLSLLENSPEQEDSQLHPREQPTTRALSDGTPQDIDAHRLALAYVQTFYPICKPSLQWGHHASMLCVQAAQLSASCDIHFPFVVYIVCQEWYGMKALQRFNFTALYD